jgi:hypothetical protein
MTSSFQWSLPPEAPFPRNAAARTTSTVLLLAETRAPRDGELDPVVPMHRPPPGPRGASSRRRPPSRSLLGGSSRAASHMATHPFVAEPSHEPASRRYALARKRSCVAPAVGPAPGDRIVAGALAQSERPPLVKAIVGLTAAARNSPLVAT